MVPFSVFGQISNTFLFDSIAFDYANSIDTNRIKSHLEILASDSFQGRKTGEVGQKIAADYLKKYFASLGLSNVANTQLVEDYSQKFNVYSYSHTNSVFLIKRDTLKPFVDYYSTDILSDTILTTGEFVFLGYGIETDIYNNYPEKDISGSIGVILSGEPMIGESYLLSGTTEPSVWSQSFISKYRAALEHGLTAIIIINKQFENSLARIKPHFEGEQLEEYPVPNFNMPRLVMSPESWNLIFPKNSFQKTIEDLENGKMSFNLHVNSTAQLIYGQNGVIRETENVYGVVSGTKFPNEYIFITAHYDHLGMDSGGNVYNGADDNGSGTSAVLELARIFKSAKDSGNGPHRSIVFMLMTSEEEGLLGSSYYSKNPLFALDSTIANLNIDMIGRTDDEHIGDTVNYIYPIGSAMISKDLNEILENVNGLYLDFNLDYRFDDPNDPQRLYYRSDHYNFARHGIPVIFFFKGIHGDYHKASDTMDKIEYDNLQLVAQLVFYTAWEVANKKDKLEKDEMNIR